MKLIYTSQLHYVTSPNLHVLLLLSVIAYLQPATYLCNDWKTFGSRCKPLLYPLTVKLGKICHMCWMSDIFCYKWVFHIIIN